MYIDEIKDGEHFVKFMDGIIKEVENGEMMQILVPFGNYKTARNNIYKYFELKKLSSSILKRIKVIEEITDEKTNGELTAAVMREAKQSDKRFIF